MKAARPKRAHSFGGCKTCRSRHPKCDQTEPRCKRCSLSGLPCDYTPALYWIISTGSDVYRRQTPAEWSAEQYSRRQARVASLSVQCGSRLMHMPEHTRESMSATLVAAVPSTATAALDKIDIESKAQEYRRPFDLEVGPFSVFRTERSVVGEPIDWSRTGRSTSDEALSRSTELDIPSSHPVRPASFSYSVLGDHDKSAAFDPEALNPGPNKPESLEDLFSSSLHSLQWGDLFSCDYDLQCQPPCTYLVHPVTFGLGKPPAAGWQTHDIHPWTGTTILSSTDPSDPDDLQGLQSLMEFDAPYLLRHFNDEVINEIGSLPINEKSPWRILNFPSAVVTLTSLSNLYAVIAVSAFHLSLNSSAIPDPATPGHHWASLSSRTYAAAKYHFGLSLDTESKPAWKAKYKDQLMAIGAILATAVSRRTPLPAADLF
ncbi:hypothetical protein TOPH_07142 [Tolypocladium ophioglossoides CBS 100239]|uniref:Zn(2)-C6 fungal-type domain-containing protein n=1 Tax=Tolypocladium ophioglossoides (strain CBS 100239) TaxID=1163406 RepID=A0A0L0N2J7_TOLOC|nr:hypothetical protein TOPH_07142 [Tolypocladium ophioglossoides CBS 100239]